MTGLVLTHCRPAARDLSQLSDAQIASIAISRCPELHAEMKRRQTARLKAGTGRAG